VFISGNWAEPIAYSTVREIIRVPEVSHLKLFVIWRFVPDVLK